MSQVPRDRTLEEAVTPEPHMYDQAKPEDQEVLRAHLGERWTQKSTDGSWLETDDDFKVELDQMMAQQNQQMGINQSPTMGIDPSAFQPQPNMGAGAHSISGISDEEWNRRQYEQLNWLEKQWSDYTHGYNYFANARDNRPGSIPHLLFGDNGLENFSTWDDVWYPTPGKPGGIATSVGTSLGKVAFSTLNLIGEVADWAGIIDKEEVTQAVPPIYYEWGQRADEETDFASGTDVLGTRPGAGGVTEPLFQFGWGLLFAASGGAAAGAQMGPGLSMFVYGAGADLIAFDPRSGSATTMLRESGWLPESVSDSAVAEFMDAKEHYENDRTLMARAAMVIEGGVLGETLGGALRLFGPVKRGVAKWANAPGTGGPMPGGMGDLMQGGRSAEGSAVYDWVTNIPEDVLNKPLSREAQAAIAEGAARYVARTKKLMDLVNSGKTPEEAILIVEAKGSEFRLKDIRGNVLRPAMSEVLGQMFNIEAKDAAGLLRTFEEGGGDLTRLILDDGIISQKEALDLLSAGGMGQRKPWTIERHAAGSLADLGHSARSEAAAKKLGRAFAEGRVSDDVVTEVDAYLRENHRNILMGKEKGAHPARVKLYKEFVDRAKSWKREHLRVATAGRPEGLTGAPAFYRGQRYTAEAVEQQTIDLMARARDGLVGRHWYENSSRGVLEMMGGNADEAEKFVQLLAITSPQNPVPNNWNHAMQLWTAWKNGDEIAWDKIAKGDRRGMNSSMAARARRLLWDNEVWEGRKTNNFYIALMRDIDPDLFTQKGWSAKFGEDLPEAMAVIDLHMMRSFGYATANPSTQQFTFAENMLQDIADRLNREGWQGGGFTSDQVQAMLWEQQRYVSKDMVAWREAVKRAEAAGKPIPPKPEMRTMDFSTVSNARQTELGVSWVPGEGSGVVSGIIDAPLEARAAFGKDMHAALHPDGFDPLADAIGMTQPRNIAPEDFATGSTISFDLPHRTIGSGQLDPAARQMNADYLRGKMLATRVDEMSSYRVFRADDLVDKSVPAAATRNGFEYPLNASYTDGLRQSLYDAVEARWGEEAWAAIEIHQTRDGGVALVNLNTELVPLKEWQEEIHGIITEWHNAPGNNYRLDVPNRKPKGFTAAGERVVHDWATDPGGTGLISGISEGRRDAVVGVVHNEIGPRAAAVYDHYAAEGFGEAGPLNVGGRTIARDAAAAKRLADNGTLAQHADDGMTVQGLARMEDGGITIINATAHGDLTTGIHELGHALRNQLFSGTGQLDHQMQEALETAFGVTDGVWTREAEEAFAEAWEALVIGGKVGPGNKEMATLAAFARDFYQEVKRTPIVNNMSPEMREAMERLALRQGLPIQWAPGKFLPAQDWSKVVMRAKQAEAEGKDWMYLVEPDDIMGTARQEADLTGAVKREDMRFDLDTDEDMMKYMALIEDVTREVRNAGVGQTRRADSLRDAEALRLFNALLGRGIDELPKTMRELGENISLWSGPGLDARFMAMQTGLSVQLKRVVSLAKRAERTNAVEDYAKLQRQFLQFQMAQAYVQRAKSQAGRGLRAWNSRISVPTWEEIGTAEGAAKFMGDLARDLDTGRDLAIRLGKLDVPEDAASAVKLVAEGSLSAGRKALAIHQEWFINGLLSAPATFISIAFGSPMFVGAVRGGLKWVGAWSRGDKEMMLEVTENLQRMWDAAGDSWKMAGRAFIKEESQLMPRTSVIDIQGQVGRTGRHTRMDWENNWLQRGVNWLLKQEHDAAVGKAAGGAGALAVNTTGRIVRSPSGVIQFFDEGFRQMNARSALGARLTKEMRDKLWAEHIESFRPTPLELEAMGARGEVWTPPKMSKDQHMAFIRSEEVQAKVGNHVQSEMDKLIRDGQFRTQEVIAKEATAPGALVTPEMAERSENLRPFIGTEINKIDDPYARGMAIYDYVDQNYTAKHAELIGYGEDYATRNVFQGELGPIGKRVQELIDSTPYGSARYIMPFVRTPIKILEAWGGTLPSSLLLEGTNRLITGVPKAIKGRAFKGVWDLNPNSLLNELHRKTMDDIMSGDPRRMAEARGRQAGGVMLFGAAYGLAESGLITGGGPKDPDIRRQWMDAGWRPYSIHVPGQGYISYLRADPYSQTLALVADTIELLEANEGLGDHQEKIGLVQALVLSMGSQLQEKTLLQGVGDLLAATQSPEAAEKWARRLSTGMTVPFSSLQRNLMDINDPALREMRSLVDAYREQGLLGDPSKVAPARNVLGEVRMKYTEPDRGTVKVPYTDISTGVPTPYLNMVNIMRWSSVTDDPIYQEIGSFDVSFRPPPESLRDIAMTMFEREGYKYTAYDEWMEEISLITLEDMREGSQTLRQRLHTYLTPDGKYHDEYMAMTNVDPETGIEEQAMFIKGIIAEYHAAARDAVLQRYPDLTRIYNERKKGDRHNEANRAERHGHPEKANEIRELIDTLGGGNP